jgi:hypothetical protein
MTETKMLRNASLLSLFLLTCHITDDIVRGMEKAEPGNLIAIPFLAIMLYGILVLAERRSGHVIMFFVGLLALMMPYLHMRGSRYAEIAASSGGFFFVWTLLALGGLGLVVMTLSVRGLWNLRSGRPR